MQTSNGYLFQADFTQSDNCLLRMAIKGIVYTAQIRTVQLYDLYTSSMCYYIRISLITQHAFLWQLSLSSFQYL